MKLSRSFPILGLLAAFVLAAAPSGAVPEPRLPVPEGLRDIPGVAPELPEGWYARIDTEMGTFVVRLLPRQAPQSVAHFAALAEGRLPWIDPFTGQERTDPYYDGVVVHKALAGERFEAGDRTGTGRGGPRYSVPPEGFAPENFSQSFQVGMTRATGGRISGVIFFVTASSQPWLNGKHPCFGDVVGGQNVVWNLTMVDTLSDDTPREPIAIEKVRIYEVGTPPPLPDPVPYEPPPPGPPEPIRPDGD